MSADPSTDLSMDMCFRRSSNLSKKCVSGEVLLLDKNNEEIHQLNATASLIWELCDGRTTLGETVRQIMERFSVEEETVWQDVKHTIEHFLSHDLICRIERMG